MTTDRRRGYAPAALLLALALAGCAQRQPPRPFPPAVVEDTQVGETLFAPDPSREWAAHVYGARLCARQGFRQTTSFENGARYAQTERIGPHRWQTVCNRYAGCRAALQYGPRPGGPDGPRSISGGVCQSEPEWRFTFRDTWPGRDAACEPGREILLPPASWRGSAQELRRLQRAADREGCARKAAIPDAPSGGEAVPPSRPAAGPSGFPGRRAAPLLAEAP